MPSYLTDCESAVTRVVPVGVSRSLKLMHELETEWGLYSAITSGG